MNNWWDETFWATISQSLKVERLNQFQAKVEAIFVHVNLGLGLATRGYPLARSYYMTHQMKRLQKTLAAAPLTISWPSIITKYFLPNTSSFFRGHLNDRHKSLITVSKPLQSTLQCSEAIQKEHVWRASTTSLHRILQMISLWQNICMPVMRLLFEKFTVGKTYLQT